MAKTNIRSIRFSDDLAELIERQAGRTFTEKFEHLICFLRLSPERYEEPPKPRRWAASLMEIPARIRATNQEAKEIPIPGTVRPVRKSQAAPKKD